MILSHNGFPDPDVYKRQLLHMLFNAYGSFVVLLLPESGLLPVLYVLSWPVCTIAGMIPVSYTHLHRQAVERGKAHRSIKALAAVDRADRRTVAKVAGDQAQLLERTAEHFCSLLGNILMAGAVEAVADVYKRQPR